MEQVEGVARACCVFDEEKKKILGFYEGGAEKRAVKEKDRGEKLPPFMLPNRFCPIEECRSQKMERLIESGFWRKGGKREDESGRSDPGMYLSGRDAILSV